MNRAACQFAHHASYTADILLHGKWRVEILCVLCSGPVRLGQLARAIPRASKKVLTQNLRDLEVAGIVVRKDFSDLVLHVEYDLNEDLRESVLGIIGHLSRWGEAYLRNEFQKHGKQVGEGPGEGT